ncbi:MAG: hypothetical protein HKN20_15550 [Gemmatimonadetes bacterium]|nr:hypothetical protein [Gemmatimonadota bacterium]
MTIPPAIPAHEYSGARALIALHEHHMREFLATWREAKAKDIALPETNDPDYETLDALLLHVLTGPTHYMGWICKTMELPEPGFGEIPAIEVIEKEADSFLDDALAKWRTPLAELPGESFEFESEAAWGPVYCVDAMLEHAVMHPIRHTFQLRNLMGK